MKQIKTLLAALFVAMAGTASAQTKNYVHITLDDNSVVHYSQDRIQSMIIDTETPDVIADYVEFTDGTNTVMVATMNLGATSVANGTASYGDYYAWGATEPFCTVDQSTGTVNAKYAGGYSHDNAPYRDKDASAYTKYTGTSDATLEAADDVVKVKKPGYHMPTQAELQTLIDACGGSFSGSTTTYDTKGIYWVAGGDAAVEIGGDAYSVNGMLFVQDATHHVFFPAAGFVSDTDLRNAGSNGYYWSSSLRTDDTDNAYSLSFSSSGVDPDNLNRHVGFPVRPFKD